MNDKIDWKDVENKISLICYKFSNLAPWHDDLAQELRMHAYYVSDNYYDLYRKAIDFWRKIQTKHSPEVPYFDLELFSPTYTDETALDQSKHIVDLIRGELNRTPNNKWDKDMLNLAEFLLDIILEDVDPSLRKDKSKFSKSPLNRYINHRLNLSWVAEETGIGYKRIVAAMKFLEDTVRGLTAIGKIDIPEAYMKDYYDE